MTPFDSSLFWPAFKAAGILTEISVMPKDCALKPYSMWVSFEEPEVVLMLTGMQSKQYQIEYQTADAPALAEGDTVTIGEYTYTVRASPFVPDTGQWADDGYFRRALLTRALEECG